MDAEGLKEGIGCMPMDGRDNTSCHGKIEATWVAVGRSIRRSLPRTIRSREYQEEYEWQKKKTVRAYRCKKIRESIPDREKE